MKITYVFSNGDVSEVEVGEEVGTVIVDSRRKEENQARRERYHCYSYDAIDFEGDEFADPDTPESLLEKEEMSQEVHNAMQYLSPIQIKRITMLAEGISVREIARREGVDHKTVLESILGAKKKFIKYYTKR